MTGSNGNKTVKVPYRLKTIQLAELKPHPKQAEVREISDEAFTALSNFIGEVGLVEEISINDRTGHIISGHQRCKVLINQGYTTAKVKVFDVDENTEDMMFTNLNSTEVSGRFTDKTKSFVQSLKARLGSEMYQKVGLQMLEVSLAEPEVEAKDGLTDPDDVPEITATKIKTGDLYQLGNHRLLCGDATKAEDVERVLAGDKPFMMVTDPPYGVGYEGGVYNKNKREKLAGDENADLYKPALALSPSNVIYLWFAGCNALPVYSAAIQFGYEPRALLIWNKLNAHYGAPSAHYKSRHEPCLYAVRNGSARFVGDMTTPTVWDIEQPHRNEHHPTQKPVECMARPIRNHGKKGDGIYDPFLGSGTTLIACEQLDRKCYGIEIEPKYVQVCIDRFEQFTGQQAQLLSRAE